jgi:hypothetical protein
MLAFSRWCVDALLVITDGASESQDFEPSDSRALIRIAPARSAIESPIFARHNLYQRRVQRIIIADTFPDNGRSQA